MSTPRVFSIGSPALAEFHAEARDYRGEYRHAHIGESYWVVHEAPPGRQTFRVLNRIEYGQRVPRTLREELYVDGAWVDAAQGVQS